MNKEQIFEIIRCGENSRVQFKERFTTQKQMAEELVAMANAKGGMIIIGCKDTIIVEFWSRLDHIFMFYPCFHIIYSLKVYNPLNPQSSSILHH